jgi:acetyl/propionyl-CoA carboxylase alpha subunit
LLYHVTIGDRTFEVLVGSEGVSVDGRAVHTDISTLDGTPVRGLSLDGASHRIVAHRLGKGAWGLNVSGRRVEAEVVDERTRAIRELTGAGAGAAGPKPIKAPMPGMVVGRGGRGETRSWPGQGVVIVEAMKMENELKARGSRAWSPRCT